MTIECSYKEKKDSWWETVGIPHELIPMLFTAITEYQTLIEGLTTDYRWIEAEDQLRNYQLGRKWSRDGYADLEKQVEEMRKAGALRGEKLAK